MSLSKGKDWHIVGTYRKETQLISGGQEGLSKEEMWRQGRSRQAEGGMEDLAGADGHM